MRKIYKILLFIFITNFFFCFFILAQDVPSNIKDELTGYETKIEQYRSENNTQLELEFLNKAAFLCWNNQLYNKAVDHFNRVIELNKQSGNLNGIMLSSNYVGMIYDEIQDYNSAITYFKKGLEISRNLNNNKNITSSLINISQTYQQLTNYDESNKWALEGVELAKEINDLKLIRSFYGILANNYQSLGDSKKSIEYFDLFASIDKYLKKEEIKDIKQQSKSEVKKAQQEKEETKQELVEQTDKLLETESSLAKVEEVSHEQKMQLDLQESKIREQAAQLKFERLVRNFLIWGFIAILIFFGVLVILYRKIKTQKTQIEEQRDTLDLQNQKINASIQYAQNIQRAILPVRNQIKNLFESFIIYRPKDIVSGDFYWFTKVKDTAFLAAVDCTGHGVPGAFMSMIGSSHLNEIVLEKQVTEPAKILSLLNEKIVESLRQNETENNDGMDVCFISIDLKSNKITFSGAKRPLFIFKNKTSEFDEIKGDRISIGGAKKKKDDEKFNNHIINAEKGDILFLSSDGLTDQNNLERKRFGSNRLKEIILNNISEPMDKQKEIIEKELDDFQQDEEQRDDITLIGIKIN
ncbi:MAG: SpoIIE family protein phosphatase [Bacteroidales bacterium]|nr:SpoIIE family protein phosphatase [Bacteroidales bacterium]